MEKETKVALEVLREHESGDPEREKKITALINEGAITKGAFYKAAQIDSGAPSVALPLCRTHTSPASPRHPHAATSHAPPPAGDRMHAVKSRKRRLGSGTKWDAKARKFI